MKVPTRVQHAGRNVKMSAPSPAKVKAIVDNNLQ